MVSHRGFTDQKFWELNLMTQAFIIDFAMESIKTTLLLSAPMLGFGLITGLTVSIFQ